MDKKLYLTLLDEKGNELKYEILMSFMWTKTNKNYIVYTDNTTDDDDNLNIYASIFYNENGTRLDPIETDYEWDEIDKRLEKLKNGGLI